MKVAVGASILNAAKEIPRAYDPWFEHGYQLIFLDGRYRTPLPPHIRAKHQSNYSTDDTEHIIKTRYEGKAIYEQCYDTQMNKRQRYLDIAGELKCDYLITFDSDDYIHPEYQEWDFFNKQLERELRPEYKDNRLYYMWAWIPDETLWPKQHNEIQSNIWRQYTRIHKDPGTMRYAQTHWTFADKKTTDHQINLWKWSKTNRDKDEWAENPYMLQPSTNTIDGIRVTTDRQLRTDTDLEFGDHWTFQQIHYEAFTYKLAPALKYAGMKFIGMDLPMEKYYFKYAGKMKVMDHGRIVDEDVGQIVLINDDGTETITNQQINFEVELKEKDRLICKECGQKL